MKVLFISEYFPPKGKGGGEISCFLLGKYLAKNGVEIHILTSKFKGTKKEEIIEGIHVHRLTKTGENPSSILSNIKRSAVYPNSVKKYTKELFKEYKFDIIHYFNINSIYGLCDINCPKVVHINSPVIFCPKGDLLYEGKTECNKFCDYKTFNSCINNSKNIGKLKNTFLLKKNIIFKKYIYKLYKKRSSKLKDFDYYLPISSYLSKRLEILGINKNKISVIPNIVETEDFKENNSDSKKLNIVYFGGYTEFKGVLILLESLKKLNKEYTCNLYGSGELKEKIRRIIENDKLNVSVNNEINYSEIPKVLSKHNVLIFPSIIPEAFGRVIVESMAAGCFPIASKIGGTTDIITNGSIGMLFEPGNSEELTKILEKLELKKINRKVLTENSKKYSGNELSKDISSIYNKLAQKK